MMKRILILALLLLSLLGTALGQNATEIVRKAENMRRGVKSSYTELTMTIIRPEWSRTMAMKSWSKGDDYALMVVTEPARDRGTATLKRDKEVWNWLPNVERTIKLPPSMMNQSWMGSDFTNDDLVRESSLVTDYTHTLAGDTTIDGRKCWKIEMAPVEGAAVIWGQVNLYIDQKDYLQLRAEFYDEDGYLVNVLKGSKIKTMDGRPVVSHLEMIPVEEEGKKTVMEIQSAKFNNPVPNAFFSVQNMKNVRI